MLMKILLPVIFLVLKASLFCAQVPPNYMPVFVDEFSSPVLDGHEWYKQGAPQGKDNEPGVISWSREGNCFADGKGNMVIRTKKEKFNPYPLQPDKVREWTSALVISARSFRHGYIEARIKVPKQTGYLEPSGSDFWGNIKKKDGFWPAFWLWSGAASDNNYREIDIFEFYGTSKQFEYTAQMIQGPEDNNAYSKTIDTRSNKQDASGDFHTYSLYWSPECIIMYYDGVGVAASKGLAHDFAMPIILNCAANDGSNSAGSVDSNSPEIADMLVDYVKIYQQKGSLAYIKSAKANRTVAGITRMCLGEELRFYGPFYNTAVSKLILSEGLSLRNGGECRDNGTWENAYDIRADSLGVKSLTLSVTYPDGYVETTTHKIEVYPKGNVPLPTPSAITISDYGCNDYKLMVAPVKGASAYIWTSVEKGAVSVDTTGENYLFLRAGFSGFVNVVATNFCGAASAARSQTVELPLRTGCSGKLALVFPNPFSDRLVIEINRNGDIGHRVELVNVLGQVVRSLVTDLDLVEMDCAELKTGVYLVRIIGLKAGEVETYKVLKQE
jgi:beta-glucanase (GH16 family)